MWRQYGRVLEPRGRVWERFVNASERVGSAWDRCGMLWERCESVGKCVGLIWKGVGATWEGVQMCGRVWEWCGRVWERCVRGGSQWCSPKKSSGHTVLLAPPLRTRDRGGGGANRNFFPLAVDPPSRQSLAYNDRGGGVWCRRFGQKIQIFNNVCRQN